MSLRDLQQRVTELERASRSAGSQMVRVAMSPSGSTAADDDESNGTGGGGCCCNEFDCLRIPGLPSSVNLRPAFYEFTPSALLCGCDPALKAQLKVRLYQVTGNLWESKHEASDEPPECLTPKIVSTPCTVTATWEWVADAPCDGNCEYICQTDPELPFTFRWQERTNTCLPGCACDDIAVGESIDGIPCNLGNNGLIHSIASCKGGAWQLLGVDDETCECTPVEPDFDGSTDGQTATTTCDSTITEESETEFELAIAYWRLTISETLDYYGCDQTKLEFIVGTKVMFTHYLQDRCGKRFCRICTTTFRLSSCAPLCADGPTAICLKPVVPVAICTCSDTPVVPLATGLTFDTGSRQESWTGDYIFSSVLDGDGNPIPCLWEIRFPNLTYDEDLNINIYPAPCNSLQHVMTRVTLTGVLTLTLNFTAPDTYCWQLSLVMNHDGVALVDLDEAGCHIAAGTKCYHRDEDILGTGLCGVYPCTDPFEMQILGYPIFTDPIVGISFLDGSKL